MWNPSCAIPLAYQIVGEFETRWPVAGQLVRRVVLLRRDRPIDLLLSEIEIVVSQGRVLDVGAGAILVLLVRQIPVGIIGDAGRGNLGCAGDIRIPGSRCGPSHSSRNPQMTGPEIRWPTCYVLILAPRRRRVETGSASELWPDST